MPKVLIMQGIPGSGKTNFARKLVEGRADWVRINRDDLRNMRGDYWVPKQESLITEFEYVCLKAAMENGYNVVYDSTNLNPKTIQGVIKVIDKHNFLDPNAEPYKVEYQMMDTPLDVCIERDSKRERPVGAAVITNFYNRYVKKDE